MAQTSWERGWVQRGNRSLYEPNELIDAVNMLPDPEGGGLITRPGDALFNTIGGTVHSLYSTYTAPQAPVNYQGAGTVLYRHFIPIVAGLTESRPISFATMPGFGEQRVFTYFAAGQEALRIKDDGTTLTNWGLKPPTLPLFAASAISGTGGGLNGVYAWRSVFVRKPVITGGVHGRWTDAIGGFTLGGTVPWFLTDGLAANNGTVFGAPQPWESVTLALTLGTGTPGGSVDYSYWNGATWVVWLTTAFGIYSATLAEFRNHFSFNAWAPSNGLYLLRARVLVNPPVIPRITSIIFYDGVFAARSNPSPPGIPSGTLGPPPNLDTAIVNFSSAFIPPDNEPQTTHVAIYRTTGDDAALLPNGLGSSAALYFFERDYPVGATQHTSSIVDVSLGELLELDNDRPPAFATIAEYQQRLFGAIGNRLHFSKRHQAEAFPGTNFLDIGSLADPIQRLAEFHGNLYIWTKARVYMLLGDSEASYDTRLVQCPTGLGAVQSLAQGERALYFLGADGHLWALQGTIAANISRSGHQQLFEGITLHGVVGLNFAALSTCVGEWALGRYMLSYPSGVFTTPSASLVIDELRGSWWRDSRAWRSLWYDRQANAFYGGSTDGKVVFLNTGATDHGNPIVGRVQTSDDDAGAPDSDKELSQLVVELRTSATGVTITPVVSYDLAGTPLATIISPAWGQHILPTPAPGAFRGLSLGYLLTGTYPWALYGLLPHVLRMPIRRAVWQTLSTNLGWPGRKIVESLLVDLQLLSGTFSWQLYADSVPVESGTVTTLGREVHQLITERHEATVFELVFSGTGMFLLHDNSVLSFRPLPPPIFNHIWTPTDFGVFQDKIGLSYCLDIHLLAAGTVTIEFWCDGTLRHTLTYNTVGRHRTERFRMPANMTGRLMEIRTQSTALYQLWGGTDFEFQPVGATASQHYRPVSQEYGSEQKIPLSQIPSTIET